MKKVFIIFLLMFLSAPAFAAEWVQYAPKGWIDVSSKQVYGDTVTVWFKDLNPGNWDKVDNKKIWFIMNQYQANCRKKTLTLLSFVQYDLNNKVIFMHNYKQYEQENEPIIPETVGEWKYYFMCGKN